MLTDNLAHEKLTPEHANQTVTMQKPTCQTLECLTISNAFISFEVIAQNKYVLNDFKIIC